jgi:hypothetical protein
MRFSGRSLWIATCNSIASLPPELRRRLALGTFFFDLPASDERQHIWNIYRREVVTGSGATRERAGRRRLGLVPRSRGAAGKHGG